MKTIRFHKTCGPEVLVYEDVPDPMPKDGEVLIRIEAVGMKGRVVLQPYGSMPEPSRCDAFRGLRKTRLRARTGCRPCARYSDLYGARVVSPHCPTLRQALRNLPRFNISRKSRLHKILDTADLPPSPGRDQPQLAGETGRWRSHGGTLLPAGIGAAVSSSAGGQLSASIRH